jgi:hypothetical protein
VAWGLYLTMLLMGCLVADAIVDLVHELADMAS